eukprot:43270-Prymnesium_polylepis.1
MHVCMRARAQRAAGGQARGAQRRAARRGVPDKLLGQRIELLDLAGEADPRARLLLDEAEEVVLLLRAL